MDKKVERNIIWTLALILILVGVFGCVTVPTATTNLTPKKVTTLDTIANMPAIANALVCMFAPSSPDCQRGSTPKLELHTR